MPDPSAHVVLGFDFGMKKIGVAVGQTITQSATALAILKAKNGTPNWANIEALITEWAIDTLVVGLPLNMDGTEQPITQKARLFGEALKAHYQLPVHFMDERLTTIAAKEEMHQTISGQARFGQADSVSAKLIVESWLRSQ